MLRRLSVALSLALGAFGLAACGGGGAGNPFRDTDPPPPAEMTAQERQFAMRVLELVNEERTENGVAQLVVWDEACARAAYGHAVDMDVRNFFDHVNPDGDGPSDRLAREGVSYSTGAENIAQGQGSPESVMSSWMNSQGHRAHILDPSYRRLGVGVHIATDGPWWVQNFVGP